MGDYSLTHKCGAGLRLDFTPFFNIQAPAAQFSHEGMRITSVEITPKLGKPRVMLYCSKCKDTIEPDSTKEIMIRCLVCRQDKPVTEVNYCEDVPAICTECTDYVLGNRKNPPQNIKETLPYIRMSKGAKLTLYSVILTQKLIY